MDKHTLAIFGGIVVAILVIIAVMIITPKYGNTLGEGLFNTGDKLLDKADIETFEMIINEPEHGIIKIQNKEKGQNGNYLIIAGEEINFEVTPNNGYKYSKIVVRCNEYSFEILSSDTQKFVAPESDIEIEVFFTPM